MTETKPALKMPEFLVFTKCFIFGFIGAEIWRTTFYLGSNFAQLLIDFPFWMKGVGILLGLALCLIYAINRGAHVIAVRIGRSLRIDLLILMSLGIWGNEMASPWLSKTHAALKSTDPQWALLIFVCLCALLLLPLLQQYWPRPTKEVSRLQFITDKEIEQEKDDLLSGKAQAESFAKNVLASDAHPGLVFGVDGPWGVGKTSFINLAERHWKMADDKVVVCRFEPLRYASEPDLTDRLIRDLSAVIQSKVFTPEFRPAASRYSRLIKGKADVSFLGFKLSLEHSQETVDELLEDIDKVLRRIGRRVIIVIDDLDRLDPQTINNVLFAVRRTFKLSQAVYVLCYDTEVLTSGKEQGPRAREFLEKFVTAKLSLFVDSSKLRDFLQRDWQRAESQLDSVPSDTMIKIGSLLNEMANILDGPLAAKYLPLMGDLRKVKRFINALLLMKIEDTNFGRTDFNKRDFINLAFLHLNYPGIFRRIYAEETEGRSGIFCVFHDYDENKFKNSSDLQVLIDENKGSVGFLLTQLFGVEALEIEDRNDVQEEILRSRACFNQKGARNLEGYLKLIVRFMTPEPRETFVLYKNAVENVRLGQSIASQLTLSDFRLEQGEHSHNEFWKILVNQSYEFTKVVAEDAINTLVEYIPRYSAFDDDVRGLRHRSIYSLLWLLDRAGWGRTSGRRLPNSPENIVEIAWRIFGEREYQGDGLIERLASNDRGVLGWNDLMLFRLHCSADRQGQLHNLHSALIVNQDESAKTSGNVSDLAILGMRKISQEVFALFKRTYIDPKRNFLAEVDELPDSALIGVAHFRDEEKALGNPQVEKVHGSLSQRAAAARSAVKSFVFYQLSNSHPASGTGVGCGFYDDKGVKDKGSIAKMMNEYAFATCFNPDIDEKNIILFLDYCLSHLSNNIFSGENEDGYFPTKSGLPGGLNPADMGRYWRRNRSLAIERYSQNLDRRVFTVNYTAFYRDDLSKVFEVLDEFSKDLNTVKNIGIN